MFNAFFPKNYFRLGWITIYSEEGELLVDVVWRRIGHVYEFYQFCHHLSDLISVNDTLLHFRTW